MKFIHRNKINKNCLIIFSLLLIILCGAYFRFVGINWDENYHLHPDERFLTMIETAIEPVENLREYFNTSDSSLNPHNVLDANGNQTFPFFVYGTFPIFLVRYVGELLSKTGYSEIHLVGRYLSGIFDLGTIVLIFFIVKELFKKSKVALLSAFFYSCATLPIQISHFFIVDNFTTFFCMLAFFSAVKIIRIESSRSFDKKVFSNRDILVSEWEGFGYYVLFSIALGLSAASKINSVAAAFLLPVAIIISSNKNYFKSSEIRWKIHLKYLALAGLLSLIVFRIFQPYAFSGPGFINFALNPKWINNIKELSALSSGLSNYPPSLQWTRRSFLFPIKNMFIWGMGIPFGFLSILGLCMMIWNLIKGNWKQYGILVAWTGIYLIWQASRWNPTMRYFLLVYPTFAIMAGWCLFTVLNNTTQKITPKITIREIINKALLILIILLLAVWAYAFTDIYRKPMTRIEASEWIYRNIEGAINLQLANESEQFTQPIPYPKYYELHPHQTLSFEYCPEYDMAIKQLAFDHIAIQNLSSESQQFSIKLISKKSHETLVEIAVSDIFRSEGEVRGQSYLFDLPTIISFKQGEEYILSITSLLSDDVLKFSGTISCVYQSGNIEVQKRIFEFAQPLKSGEPYSYTFSPIEDGILSGISLFRVRPAEIGNKNLTLSVLIRDATDKKILATGELYDQFSKAVDFRGQNFSIILDKPIDLEKGSTYELILGVDENTSLPILLYGSKTAKETDWDDTLPLFMYGFNPFDNYSGVYQSDLNFQMYWDDNEEKFSRFTSILDQADYIIFSSNRQWGSVTQAPEKYPLSTYFYSELIGCNLADVQKCYIQAEPAALDGNLGFKLEEVFKSEHNVFGLEINTQFAEEAFSVYDHPKVFIFEKTDEFSYLKAVEKLSNIDLKSALNISPQDIEKRPGLLVLPDEIIKQQEYSGTWSELFSYESIQNKNPLVTVIIWYVSITIFGWMMYPITRLGFKGLKTKGWAITRIVALVLLTFFVWIMGSIGVQIERATIAACAIVLLLINGALFHIDRKCIIEEITNNWKTIVFIEGFSLAFFIFFILIRIGNPDLWHPYKGGEKPMDFAYFNAVIKSTTFPPYDPWYSGGYINYYYWGFLLAAVPTKLMGIVPSIAYNLILPSFFSFTAMAAYCIGINLPYNEKSNSHRSFKKEIRSGLIAAIFMLIIGNLGTVKMSVQGFQRLAEAANPVFSGNAFNGIKTFFEGIKLFLVQGKFNYYPGDWYWIPSRAIPGEPITEFPYFTFLYGDPHAHLFALPITLIALAWTISLLAERMHYEKKWVFPAKLLIGGIIIGSLRPTNTWDYPVSLFIACAGLVFSYLKYVVPSPKLFPKLSQKNRRVLLGFVVAIAFGLLSYYLFIPFTKWYGQGYTAIDFWKGDKTSIGSYLTHWGFFVFIVFSWLINELIDWMKETPLSDINKYYPYRKKISVLIIFVLILLVVMVYIGVVVGILIIPVLLILSLLIFRKKYSDKEKFILLLSCIGLGLTLLVELIVLSGDIGRMNTVFKFYLQAWTCLSLSSSWYIYQLILSSKKYKENNYLSAWRTFAILLFISVLMFPIIASADKITDRMSPQVPITLDGMEYMRYSSYLENSKELDLRQDYDLIRWMQENISGTPTIIEANVPEYRWGNRISIYTGLPSVIGWNWHQRQQRVINPSEWVFNRVEDVEKFYSGTELSTALDLVDKYNIEYIVVGQLERAIYTQEGIEKFFTDNSDRFEVYYSNEDTYLLKVVQ
ncbi:MAG: DUF2298 domain-containing protein [Pelolinea sp.]|nr:DUF2298 domain-containing protein [Pelolinea sp.]